MIPPDQRAKIEKELKDARDRQAGKATALRVRAASGAGRLASSAPSRSRRPAWMRS